MPNLHGIVCFKNRQLLYLKLHYGRLKGLGKEKYIHLLKLCARLKVTLA